MNIRHTRRLFRAVLPLSPLLGVIALASSGRAQCANIWLPGDPVAGTNGPVYASAMWDADGAGPAPTLLVVAGEFQTAGDVAANNIAAWNPATGAWQALGAGTEGRVNALAALPNGELVATGEFTTAGGAAASRIARWNGIAWAPLGTGLGGPGDALTTLANGDVVVGGRFTTAGGVLARYIARWNGTAWSSFGTGFDYHVLALTTTPAGDLVVGGRFSHADGVPANHIARWNGTSWSAFGSGTNGDVRAVLALANGDVVTGGFFTTAGGVAANFVARWSGSAWSALGTGFDGGVTDLLLAPNGDVLASGHFSNAGGSPASHVARWNSTAWAGLGAGAGAVVHTLTLLPNGDALAAGEFVTAGGAGAARVARWNGSAWAPLTAGTNGPVVALATQATLAGTYVVAGGSFTTIGGVAANGLARWDGTAWSAIPGTPGFGVTALAILSGTTIAVAYADHPVFRVATWDGTTWMTIGTFSERVAALLRTPYGDLVAGGNFAFVDGLPIQSIARWDGTSWSALGSGIVTGTVHALAIMQPGFEVVAGGIFVLAGGAATEIAAWNGATWTSMSPASGGSGVGVVTSLGAWWNGDGWAGGYFPGPSPQYLLRRSGGTWQSLGTGTDGPVHAMIWLPNGDLIAGGSFTTAGGVPTPGLARWNGTTWSPFTSGTVGGHAGHVSPVLCLATLRHGEIIAGGHLTNAGGLASAYFARARTTCPALAVQYGTGCPATSIPAGPMTMFAGNLPWLGSSFTAGTTGVSWLGFALGVLGLAPTSIPMPAVLPQGVAGCTLYASPDLLTLWYLGTTTVNSWYAIPNAPVLANQQLFHQLVLLETPFSTAITAITSSSALALTIGQW